MLKAITITALIATCTAAFPLTLAGLNAATQPDNNAYVLIGVIGYDCQGASGPLLAEYESDLPECAIIEPLPQTWAINVESE